MMKKKRVLLGLSGGVDSSVSAALLLEQGYDVVAVYMNLWADPTIFDLGDSQKFPQNKCCSIESLLFARQIAQKMGIPFYSVNLEAGFRENVVEFFLEGFRQGETPNPCVRCNKTIKFGALFKKMEELDCDYLATGHYARLKRDSEGKVHLLKGEDSAKDQTYFLYNLSQEKLQKILFPLGDYDKSEVKALAEKFGLEELKGKRESQGVCFYPEKTHLGFLERYLKAEKDYEGGAIMDESGQVLGEHKGLPFYTIGQRKVGVGGQAEPLFVKRVDSIRNALILGTEAELFANSIQLREVNFLAGHAPADKEKIFDVKIRSHGKTGQGRIKILEGDPTRAVVEFLEPQRAVMAGQSLVLYDGDELIGGGIMEVPLLD